MELGAVSALTRPPPRLHSTPVSRVYNASPDINTTKNAASPPATHQYQPSATGTRSQHSLLLHPRLSRSGNRYNSTWWSGVCVDSGPERSEVKWNQAREYTTYARASWRLTSSRVFFRFGDALVPGEGTIRVRIHILEHCSLLLSCYVVRADIPLLLGLDAPREFGH